MKEKGIKRVKVIVFIVLAVVLTILAAVYGYNQRGYFGVGGEFLIPVLLYFVMYMLPVCHRDFKKAMTDEW